MRRYLQILKGVGIYALLLPVNGMLAHFTGDPHRHGNTFDPGDSTSPSTWRTATTGASTYTTGNLRSTHRGTRHGTNYTRTPHPRSRTAGGRPVGYTGDGTPGNPFRPREGADGTPTRTPHSTGGTPFSSRSTASTGGTPARRYVPKGSTPRRPGQNQRNQGNQGNQGNQQNQQPDAYEIAEQLADERGIGNQYGQRSRYIEREAERIAKAQRQDRINQEARERAIRDHDDEFLEEMDRTLQERYGPSGSAFGSHEDWGRAYDHLWQERGLPMDSDASARQPQASNADLVNEVINQVQAMQDRYRNNPEALAAKLKILAGTGKYDGVVATTEGGGEINLRDYIEGNAQFHDSRANLMTTARGLNIPTQGRTDQEIADHINQVIRANAVGAANQLGISTVGKPAREIWEEVRQADKDRQGEHVSPVLDFLETRGYDVDSLSNQEAIDEYNRLDKAQYVGDVLDAARGAGIATQDRPMADVLADLQAAQDAQDAEVFHFLKQRGYDTNALSTEEAYAERNRLAEASSVQAMQDYNRNVARMMELAQSQGLNVNDDDFDLTDAQVADWLKDKADQFRSAQLVFLHERGYSDDELDAMDDSQLNAAAQRESGLLETLANRRVGQQHQDLMALASEQGLNVYGDDFDWSEARVVAWLENEAARARNAQLVFLQGLGYGADKLDAMDDTQLNAATQRESGALEGRYRRQLAEYLTLRNPEDFTTPQLEQMGRERQEVLGKMQDYQLQQMDTARFAADPETGRPSALATGVAAGQGVVALARHEQKLRDRGIIRDFPTGDGATVSLNMLDLDPNSPEYQAALAYSEAQKQPVQFGSGRLAMLGEGNELATFTTEALDLQENIAQDEEYERDASREHTFQTADGPVTFSAKDISTTDGNLAWSRARQHAIDTGDQATRERLEEVRSLWQHPDAIARKRVIAAAVGVGLVTLPFAPTATLTSALKYGAVGAVSSPAAGFTFEELKSRTGIFGGGPNPYLHPDGTINWELVARASIEGAAFGALLGPAGAKALRPVQGLGSRVFGGSSGGVRGKIGGEVGEWVGEGAGETLLLDTPMTIIQDRRLPTFGEFGESLAQNIWAEPFEDAAMGVGRRGGRLARGMFVPQSVPAELALSSAGPTAGQHGDLQGPYNITFPDGTTQQFQSARTRHVAIEAYKKGWRPTETDLEGWMAANPSSAARMWNAVNTMVPQILSHSAPPPDPNAPHMAYSTGIEGGGPYYLDLPDGQRLTFPTRQRQIDALEEWQAGWRPGGSYSDRWGRNRGKTPTVEVIRDARSPHGDIPNGYIVTIPGEAPQRFQHRWQVQKLLNEYQRLASTPEGREEGDPQAELLGGAVYISSTGGDYVPGVMPEYTVQRPLNLGQIETLASQDSATGSAEDPFSLPQIHLVEAPARESEDPYPNSDRLGFVWRESGIVRPSPVVEGTSPSREADEWGLPGKGSGMGDLSQVDPVYRGEGMNRGPSTPTETAPGGEVTTAPGQTADPNQQPTMSIAPTETSVEGQQLAPATSISVAPSDVPDVVVEPAVEEDEDGEIRITPRQAPGLQPVTSPETDPLAQPSVFPSPSPEADPFALPGTSPETRPATAVETEVRPVTEPAVQLEVAPAINPAVTPVATPATQPATGAVIETVTQPAIQPEVAPATYPVTPTVVTTPGITPAITPGIVTTTDTDLIPPVTTPELEPDPEPSPTPLPITVKTQTLRATNPSLQLSIHSGTPAQSSDSKDFAIEEISSPEGTYPEVIQYDQLVRVTHNLDTGEERVDSLSQPTPVQIVETDLTPPGEQVRYAGNVRVTPMGGTLKTQGVKTRKKKSSRERHPFLKRGELGR